METIEQEQGFYMTVGSVQYPVSEEVFKAVSSENNAVRRIARKEHRCFRSDFKHCSGDCFSCQFHTTGILTTYEAAHEDESIRFAANSTSEEEAVSGITMQKVYAWADKLVKDGALILSLRFEDCCTYREIAQIVGVSPCMVQKRMGVIADYLRKHREEFF